jgi:hypothetical protein
MEKENGLSASADDWIKMKKRGECTKDPLTCLPSTFINIIGSQDMKVRCARTGKACDSSPVFSA